MKTVVYIHGAFSSGVSFRHLIDGLPAHNVVTPEYTVDEPLTQVIDRINDQVNALGTDVDIVAHSLGGIVATGLGHINDRVQSVLTMSTPFGGSRIASALSWFNGHELYKSLASNSPILRAISGTKLPCRLRSIITTVGNNPMMFEKNDGVISLRSQVALGYGEKIHIPLNHFEILLSKQTIDLIKDFTFK